MKPTSAENYILTNLGKIAVFKVQGTSDKTPVIFLHGVYFDHHLWDEQLNAIRDRTVIAIDMPLHGASRDISKSDWTLNDCAKMLLEILNELQIAKVIAVGHSWGSMTILRATHMQAEKFESVILCNMPYKAATKKQKIIFRLQHSLLILRNFYTRETAKALFGKSSLKENPGLLNQLKRSMNLLSSEDIVLIDKIVIRDAEDTTDLILHLKVNGMAIKGEEDYVPAPPEMNTHIIKGGHVSPIENPSVVTNFIKSMIN